VGISIGDSVVRLCERVQEASRPCGADLYLVGGVVRDLARGVVSVDADLDLMVAGDARIVARAVAEQLGGTLTTHDRFLTANVSGLSGFGALREVDFASARTESYPVPGALPEVRLAAVEEDLKRRDFTVNAMAIELGRFVSAVRADNPIRSVLKDPFGGLCDLEQRVLRVLHRQSFVDDPTRIFRGVRYASRLQFTFEQETDNLARGAIQGGALGTISSARWVNEWRLLLDEPQMAKAVLLLRSLGALHVVPGFRAERASEIERIAARMQSLGVAARLVPPLERLFLLFITAIDPTSQEAFMSSLALRKSRGKALRSLIQSPPPNDLRGGSSELQFIHACGIGHPESDVALQALCVKSCQMS